MEDEGGRDWVWTGVDGGEDGGERDWVRIGCGRGCGWKMKGSETGCEAVWTGVWMEDGGERDWVWTGVWMEDEGERDWARTGVERGLDGKGGRCGWAEAMYEACFRVSPKHEVEVAADGDDPGGKGVVVWGQRSCTKHVSGLV